MHDDVAGIDQHPVALGRAVDRTRAIALFLQPPRQMVGDRRHMARRTSRRHHRRVAQRGAPGQIDGDDLFRLVVFQRRDDALQQSRSVPAALRGAGALALAAFLAAAFLAAGFLAGFLGGLLRGRLFRGGFLAGALARPFSSRLSGCRPPVNGPCLAWRQCAAPRARAMRGWRFASLRAPSRMVTARGGRDAFAHRAEAPHRRARSTPPAGCRGAAPPRWEHARAISCQRRQRLNWARLSLPISQTNCTCGKAPLQRPHRIDGVTRAQHRAPDR